MTRVESVASKCVNQYRSRDIFAYLSLRYCLEADVAKTDSWIETNAVQAVLGSPTGSYMRTYHFKQIDDQGDFESRELFVPSAVEALAEVALLAKCTGSYGKNVQDRVFSYRLTDKTNKSGSFEAYMIGLRERQAGILNACDDHPNGQVVYIDIKKFYPSITSEIATTKWLEFSSAHQLAEVDIDLGIKLLQNHKIRSSGESILTGPMFSHFVANLVLDEVDEYASSLPVKYFRYVDDITVVGESDDVEESIKLISEYLSGKGFEVHSVDSPKTLKISTRQWCKSSNDFSPGRHSLSWMRLIGDIKRLLLFDPLIASSLEDGMLVSGIRLPVPDYAVAVKEASSFRRVRQLGLWQWLRLKTKRVNLNSILADAAALARSLHDEVESILNSTPPANAYDRKRTVSKLRYRLGRLVFIGEERRLEELLPRLRDWAELSFHYEVIKALITLDCANIVAMGSNVAQATAQVFKPALKTAHFSRTLKGDKEMQGLAVFILNGVPVTGAVENLDNPLLRFAKGPVDLELIESPRGLLQELACLHGLGDARHRSVLRSAFDLDEMIVLDALQPDYGYSL